MAPHSTPSYDPHRASRSRNLSLAGALPAPARERPDRETAEDQISRAIVRLLREHTARGPSDVRTAIYSEMAIVTLRDCLSGVERRLAGRGHAWLVMRTRAVVYDAMRAGASAVVESTTGRRVTSYLTDQGHEPDLAVIVFVFGDSTRGRVAA